MIELLSQYVRTIVQKKAFGVKVNKHSFVWPAKFTLIAICSQMLQITL